MLNCIRVHFVQSLIVIYTCSAVLRIVLLNNNCANQLCMNTLYRQTMVVSYIHFVKVHVVVCGLGVSIFQKLSSG